MKLKRYKNNPILIANEKNNWEADSVFNGCVVKDKKKFYLLYRAISYPIIKEGISMQISSIGYASSSDGFNFKSRRQFIRPEYDWEKYGCEDPRVTKLGDKYYIFYTALSTYPFSAEGIKVGLAITKDFKTIEEKHPITTFDSKAMALFPEKIGDKFVAILTVNTDKPPAKIAIALFDKEEDMWSNKYWDNWYSSLDSHVIPLLRSSNDHIEIGAPPIKTKEGWLLIYSYIENYLSSPKTFGVEAVLLDLQNPQKIIGRITDPLLVPEEDYELKGKVPNIVFPSGALVEGKKLFLYYGAADTSLNVATTQLNEVIKELTVKKQNSFSKRKSDKVELKRFGRNPIITPRPEFEWEAKATFNAATIHEEEKVHIVYRAMSNDNTSVFGYANSKDGVNIDERSPFPIYIPREDFEKKTRAGNSGCEDPRITRIDDTLYMTYTAFDGINPPRIALTSISLDDFLNKQWAWTKPILISPPGLDDKDSCVLPKKINGKYIIFHRIDTCICVNVLSDLNFGDNKWLKKGTILSPRPDKWDNAKIGIAAPPIETKDGWLLIYHGISEPGTIYKLGAVLLDLKNPTKVIGRADHSIFEPEMKYEKEGQVPNVVFSCGAVVIKDELLVYYGGADKVLGVAKADLKDVLVVTKQSSI